MKTTVQQQRTLAFAPTALWAALCLLSHGGLLAADVPAQKTLSLHAVPSPRGLEIQVQAVERTTINTNQCIDLTGMRLWV